MGNLVLFLKIVHVTTRAEMAHSCNFEASWSNLFLKRSVFLWLDKASKSIAFLLAGRIVQSLPVCLIELNF